MLLPSSNNLRQNHSWSAWFSRFYFSNGYLLYKNYYTRQGSINFDVCSEKYNRKYDVIRSRRGVEIVKELFNQVIMNWRRFHCDKVAGHGVGRLLSLSSCVCGITGKYVS